MVDDELMLGQEMRLSFFVGNLSDLTCKAPKDIPASNTPNGVRTRLTPFMKFSGSPSGLIFSE